MRMALLTVLLALVAPAAQYSVTGLVIKIDAPHQTLFVSHGAIPGYMDAMLMGFHVREPKSLETLEPGMKVKFTLVVDSDSSWARDVEIVPFDSAERDPVQVRRLKSLEAAIGYKPANILPLNQTVPDFSLIDQTRQRVTLSQFRGKVVGINFVYTRCPLPDYCFRLTNNFGGLQKRFVQQMGRDLILLTVTFDPLRDQPEVLAEYARIWKADPRTWHFLTGSLDDVERICGMFGVRAWQDEGTMTHSLHTAIIDRTGKLVANLEGNQYAAQQLGDLVESVLNHPPD